MNKYKYNYTCVIFYATCAKKYMLIIRKEILKNETLNLRLGLATFIMFAENELVLLHIIP